MSDLPEFQPRQHATVHQYVHQIFGASMVKLIEHPDHHYRVVFRKEHFYVAEGKTEPSKSQWSSLKKKMKRHDRQVFLFKQVGTQACPNQPDDTCYYLEFGFFRY